MTTYKNGPGNVPRLPDAVVDTLVDRSGVDVFGYCGGQQLDELHTLVHSTCEELLARLPAPAKVSSQQPFAYFRDSDGFVLASAWCGAAPPRGAQGLYATPADLEELAEDGRRFRFLRAAAVDPNSVPGRAMEWAMEQVDGSDPRPGDEVLIETVDKARTWAREAGHVEA